MTAERDLLTFPVRMGGLGITKPRHIAASEYEASTAKPEPLVKQIVVQTHELRTIMQLEHCSNETVRC